MAIGKHSSIQRHVNSPTSLVVLGVACGQCGALVGERCRPITRWGHSRGGGKRWASYAHKERVTEWAKGVMARRTPWVAQVHPCHYHWEAECESGEHIMQGTLRVMRVYYGWEGRGEYEHERRSHGRGNDG